MLGKNLIVLFFQVSVIQMRRASVRSNAYEEDKKKEEAEEDHLPVVARSLSRLRSRKDAESLGDENVDEDEEKDEAAGARLIEQEAAVTGGVSSEIYIYYTRCGGKKDIFCFCTCCDSCCCNSCCCCYCIADYVYGSFLLLNIIFHLDSCLYN